MNNDQVVKILEGLSDEQLVIAVATGKQILEMRFAEAAKRLALDQKRMLTEAVAGRKRTRRANRREDGNNVLSKAAQP